MPEISAEELKQAVKLKEDIFLLDVRTELEYDEHFILGAVNIPFNELHERIGEVPQSKKVITISQDGVRSKAAAKFLRANGFKAESMKGGMEAWDAINTEDE